MRAPWRRFNGSPPGYRWFRVCLNVAMRRSSTQSLEVGSRPSETLGGVPANENGAEGQEGLGDLGVAFVVCQEPAEVMKPRKRPFRDPAVPERADAQRRS